ncbi:cell division protein ZapB [Halomonas halocynthiae]|uniref:cell division protein ZapB n=1 Tax=Halomonas halocynthiae TaxID=176290 RepID=UPI0003F5ADED|nr:cell division protein ZapB [Halomonas halocynthiae]
MSIEIFNQLEQKVTSAVEALELMKMEVEELREENTRLKQAQEDWNQRLTSLLGKLNEVDLGSSAPSHENTPL